MIKETEMGRKDPNRMTHPALRTIVQVICRLRGDQRGQDMIEYALLGASGFLAVAVVLPQQMMPTISTIMSSVGSVLARASNGS